MSVLRCFLPTHRIASAGGGGRMSPSSAWLNSAWAPPTHQQGALGEKLQTVWALPVEEEVHASNAWPYRICIQNPASVSGSGYYHVSLDSIHQTISHLEVLKGSRLAGTTSSLSDG